MTIKGYEAYKSFLAIKSHFTTSYDYFKYNKKIKTSVAGYEARKDKYKFEKLANQKDLEGFLISNFACGNVNWVGDLFEDSAEQVYTDWLRRNQALTYRFKEELSPYAETFKELFKVHKGQYPKLIILYRQKKICLETLVILNSILNFTEKWDEKISDTVVWPMLRDKINNYAPFVQYDRKKFQNILKEMVFST